MTKLQTVASFMQRHSFYVEPGQCDIDPPGLCIIVINFCQSRIKIVIAIDIGGGSADYVYKDKGDRKC